MLFSTFENIKFKEIISIINKDVNLPCSTTVSHNIIKKKEVLKLKLREKVINSVQTNFSITTDAWSTRMYIKLEKYSSLACNDVSNLALILDSRFRNDIIDDSILLRYYVQLKDSREKTYNQVSDRNSSGVSSFIDSLLDEDSNQGLFEDEVIMLFLILQLGSVVPILCNGGRQKNVNSHRSHFLLSLYYASTHNLSQVSVCSYKQEFS